MKVPQWYPKAHQIERFNFLLNYAALHATQQGTLHALANSIGVTPTTVSMWKRVGKVSTIEYAMKIEALAGREFVTWESLVNPASAIQQQ